MQEEEEEEIEDEEETESLPDSVDEIYPSENEEIAVSSEEGKLQKVKF